MAGGVKNGMKTDMTARMSAFARGYYASLAGAEAVYADGAARLLLSPEEWEAMEQSLYDGAAFFGADGVGDRQAVVGRIVFGQLAATPVYRAAFIERALRGEARLGTRQYAILGCGLDGFSACRPPWAADIRVFALDRAEVLEDRAERLRRAGVPEDAETRVPAELLSQDPLAPLLDCPSFDRTARCFFSLAGVLQYLPHDAAERLFAGIGRLAAGTAVAFDCPMAHGAADAGRERRAAMAAAAGAPMREEWTCRSLEAALERAGLLIHEYCAPKQIEAQFGSKKAAPDRRLPAESGVSLVLAVKRPQ